MRLPEKLRALLVVPPAADEDRSRTAQTISTLCLVLLVVLLPVVAHNGYSKNWTMVAAVGTAWAGLFLPLALARRGMSETAGLAFVALMIPFLAVVVVLSTLGVFDVAMIAFPGLIVCSGLILEGGAAFAATVVMILGTVTALYAATLAGSLHNPLGDRFDFGAIIDANLILLVTAIAVRFLRRQFSESLRRARSSERQMRAIFETSPESITLLDQQGTIVAANPHAAESLGVARGGLDGHSALDLIVPTDRARALVELERVQAGAMVHDKRFDFRHADGRVVPGEVSAAPLHDGDGKTIGVVVQSRDISERLRTQENLDQLQRQFLQAQKMESVGRLAGGVAHDLNNFLTAIMGFGELARLGTSPSAPAADHLDKLLQAADRSRAVVSQLLTFARRQVHQPREVALNELIFGFTGLLRPLIGEHITLRTEFDADAGAILIDPSQMEQVLINLAVNARDAMPDGGTLVIATGRLLVPAGPAVAGRAPGDYATITVRDTGAGFTEEALTHLFEPFFTTKALGKGTGLGLATCFGIVQQSGGSLEVESQPAAGTTVRIVLPRTAGSAPAGPAEAGSVARGGTETLLLVEDEHLVRAAAVEGLRSQGYTVHPAADAGEALRIAATSAAAFSLLITDIVMPGMSGFTLAETLRARQPGLRVLYLSGYAEEIGSNQEIVRDPSTFLAKPYTSHQLAARVRELLELSPEQGGAAPQD
jgi:PAS domain S-box-containing protein